jgi:hypothetical protein
MKRLIHIIFLILVFPFLLIAGSKGAGLESFRDDALAQRYAPVIVQDDSIPARPERLLYRMARGENENDGKIIKIAYHVVWPFEKDNRKGFYSWWTRVTYTGGLNFQGIIYGPGDVEGIELTVDAETGKIIKVLYETADWDEKGRVIHVHVERAGEEIPSDPHLVFQVISWNHMFDLISESELKEEPKYELASEYFSEKDWRYYRMTKKRQTPLKRDRAHFEWEVEVGLKGSFSQML